MRKFTLLVAGLFIGTTLFAQSALSSKSIEKGTKEGPAKIEQGYKSISNANASTSKDYIYFEGFETSLDASTGLLPEGWTQKRTATIDAEPTTDAESPKWFRQEDGTYGFDDPGYVRSGIGSLAIGYTAEDFTWAISPEIAVPTSAGNPIFLEWWHWYKNGFFQGVWYYTNYYVAINNGSEWTVVQSILGPQEALADDDNHFYDESQLIDLASFQGQTIQIAFIYQFTDGFQMAIDDISIYEVPNDDFYVRDWYIGPTFSLTPGTPITIGASVTCNGLNGGQPNVYLKVNDEVVETVQTSAELLYGDSEDVEFTYTPDTYGDFAFEITMDDDDINSNHTVGQTLHVYQYIAFAEDFENIDWTDPENPVVIFPPAEWNVTSNENDWTYTVDRAIKGQISAAVGQFDGDPESILVTPAIEKNNAANTLGFWKSGLNNGITQEGTYLGHSTLVVKYSNEEWPVTTWTDLETISLETGDAAEYIEIDISSLPNDTYHFAFTTTSTFNFPDFLSWVQIDNVIVHKSPEAPMAVTFEVEDESAAAITDAIVTFDGVEYAAGEYEFSVEEVGTYSYLVKKDGFITAFGEVMVDMDVTESVVLTAGANPTYTVTFTVVDNEENPVADAIVTFDGVEGTANEYVIADVEAGVYAYTVAKDGYESVTGNVTVTDADVTVDVVLVPASGVNSSVFDNLTAYPNPFSNEITLNDASKVERVVIYNLVGQMVMDVRMTSNTINTSDLSSGVYVVTFVGSNGERAVRKMIKQ